jgi:peptidoglycan/xylan/chitin deacetylase (PgdA/CDA1 family)
MLAQLLPSSLYLTWHGVGEPHGNVSAAEARYWIPVVVFAATLAAIPALEAEHRVKVHLTFDDGNESDYSQAFRLLQHAAQTGMFFICASRIDQPDYLSTVQLRDMHKAGMTIGSHGFDHVNWRAATEDQLQHELVGSRARIEDALGAPITMASVPFGMIDRRVAQSAIKAGFTRLFTSSGGFATSDTGLIPRHSIVRGFDPAVDLAQLMAVQRRAKSALRDPIRRLRYWY